MHIVRAEDHVIHCCRFFKRGYLKACWNALQLEQTARYACQPQQLHNQLSQSKFDSKHMARPIFDARTVFYLLIVAGIVPSIWTTDAFATPD
jgi:hypothetical protein